MIERLEIELSRRCGLRCLHCSVDATSAVGDAELTTEEWVELVEQFARLGGQELVITGGEPLLHGGLNSIVGAAKRAGLSVRLYTAAYSATPSVVQNLTALDLACISIEGNSLAHDALTGIPGSHAAAIRGLSEFRSRGVPVRIHFTPTRRNYRDFADVVNLAESTGAMSVKVLKFRQQGRGETNSEHLTLTSAEEAEFLGILDELRSRSRIEITYGGKVTPSTECGIGKKLLITNVGDARRCLGLRNVNDSGAHLNVRSMSLATIVDWIESGGSSCRCAVA